MRSTIRSASHGAGRATAGRAGGYTMVEMLVAMVVGVMVLGGIYQLLQQNQRVYKTQSQLTEIQQIVRTAMDVMVRDIRQVGNDPNRSVFGAASSPVPGVSCCAVTQNNSLRILMDLPRDCGGAPGDNSNNCPSTAICGGGSCLDGDTWDILDKNGAGGIQIGNPAVRGENEFGNGVIGDTNPDEDVQYWYDAPSLRVMRTVRVLSTGNTTTVVTEPLADYIELGATPLFQYIYPAGAASGDRPSRVIITLRGRTKDPDPQSNQFRYYTLTSDVKLINIVGGI